MPDEKPKPKVNLRFVFSMCNDIAAMKKFYTDLLGMQGTAFFNEEQFGYLAYKCDGLDFMFFKTHGKVHVKDEWTWQPGYEGGSHDAVSWAIEVPMEDFAATVKRLREASVRAFSGKPEWRQDSYWGYSVMDPMGNTVEVYVSPKEKPENREWVD